MPFNPFAIDNTVYGGTWRLNPLKLVENHEEIFLQLYSDAIVELHFM